MKIAPGHVYFLEHPRLRASTHGPPCVVLQVHHDRGEICYLSTKFELKVRNDLTLIELENGFKDTGLSESSYLVHRNIVTVPIQSFDTARLLGRLTERVKELVDDWYGMELK